MIVLVISGTGFHIHCLKFCPISGKGKELSLQTMEGKVYNNERKDPVDDHEGSDDSSCAGIEQRLSLLTMGDKDENESKDPEDESEGADDVSGRYDNQSCSQII